MLFDFKSIGDTLAPMATK